MDDWVDVVPTREPAKPTVISVTKDHFRQGRREPFEWKTDPFSIAVRESLGVSSALVGWAVVDTYKDNIKTQWNIAYKDQKKVRESCIAWRRGIPKPVTFSMYRDREVDVTPKTNTRKPRRTKNFTDIQIEANRRQQTMEL